MYSKEVELAFNDEGRSRAGAFKIKRSKTKRVPKSKIAEPLDISMKDKNKNNPNKIKHIFKSEKLKKRIKLIEDYFYPEETAGCIDPTEHIPILTQNSSSLKVNSARDKSRHTLTFLEGSQALKEMESNKKNTFLNCSIVETIKKIIKIDEGDITSFDNWDKDTNTPYTENVLNDIKRSRIRDSLDKESILEDLLLIIIFYCENNTIVYQQGMQDIIIPFVYLKSKEFSLAEVYAYTKGYIEMFMPNTLHSKFNGTDYSLPHLQ